MLSTSHEPDERSVEYDPETDSYHTTYDGKGEERLSARVLRAVAATAGTCPTELDERLADVVDPDALDLLLEPSGDALCAANGGVWFDFSGHRVVVYADGEIEVRPASSSADLGGPGIR